MKLSHFCGLCLTALLAASASANITPGLEGPPTLSGGTYTYDYLVSVDNVQDVVDGSVFCLADVDDLTGASGPNAMWTVSINDSGGCSFAAGTTVPNVGPSVTFTYIGSATLTNESLGTFAITSTDGNIGLDAYGGQALSLLGKPTANQGDVAGPAAVPEPATTGLICGGLTLMALVARRKRVQRA